VSPKPLRILHLEDSPEDAELVKATLSGEELSCDIVRIETRKAFMTALEREPFDVILADYKLPGFNGMDALKLAVKRRPDTPFIFVSGTIGEEFAVLTLHLGATDYVLKNKLVRLPAAVRRAINEAAATATRMRMEESLRLQATRMKSIIDTSLDAIIVIDEQGCIIEWNKRAEALFGWQKDEAIGRIIAETIIPARYREAHARGLTQFLATGEGPMLNRLIEIVALHQTGYEIQIELAITPTKINGKWQFTAFIADITKRKQAERRLAAQYAVTQVLAESPTLQDASAKILRVLCESLGWEVGAIWRVDRDANLLRCLEIWHVPQAEAAEFVAVSRQRTFLPDVGMPGRVWARGEPTWIPDVLQDSNFPRAPMAAKAGLHGAVGFPIKIGKNVYGIIEFFSHEIREPDIDLLQMLGDIGNKIGQFIERTQAEDALRERDLARLSSERANQAKSEFLSRMSHELRTPLNAILGFAQLLEMDPLTPDQHESIARILHGGRHLLNLINEVLDISRIEAGHMRLSLEPVSLQETVREALDLIRPLTDPRHITVRSDMGQAEGLHVKADHQRLRQVMLNLLSNAVKYNRESGSVTVTYMLTADRYARVAVTDTGAGISSEKLARLFMPFDRLGAEQMGIEGTGLGLSLTKHLMEAMGGRLGVDSVVGQGSTFWVEMTVVPPSTGETAISHPAAPADLSTRPLRTMLYIEDNLSNLELIQKLLATRPEIKLLSAMQGRLGLDLARHHKPDLILLDLHLPDLGGEVVLLQLKAEPALRDIPVIILSADASQSQIEQLRASGAHAYLTKPLNLKQLLALLSETLA
jgi:two-component system cell cycle sensor histidine kinase/response regulator CckA